MAEVATGITISFSTGFLAEILNVNPPNASRESIPTSHQGTSDAAHTFTPAKLVDWGELNVDIAFVPSTTPITPMTSAAEEIVITFPDSTETTWTFDGFATAFDITGDLETRMEASMTIKVTGVPVIA